MESDDVKRIEDILTLIESNLRATREYLDERIAEVQELEDEIIELLRKGGE